jgi:hypothetical protein
MHRPGLRRGSMVLISVARRSAHAGGRPPVGPLGVPMESSRELCPLRELPLGLKGGRRRRSGYTRRGRGRGGARSVAMSPRRPSPVNRLSATRGTTIGAMEPLWSPGRCPQKLLISREKPGRAPSGPLLCAPSPQAVLPTFHEVSLGTPRGRPGVALRTHASGACDHC